MLWAVILGLTVMSLAMLLLPLVKKGIAPRYFFIVFPLVLLSASLCLYHYWGNPGGLAEKEALGYLKSEIAQISKDPNIPREQAMEAFAALESKIAYSPVALTQMASVYNQLGLVDEALEALNKAMTLSPKDIEIQVQWIYSHSLKNQGKLSLEQRQKAQEIMQVEPQQYVLLNLMAIDDYFQGNYAKAAQEWATLLASDKALVQERRQVIEAAMLKARSFIAQEEQSSPVLAVKVKLSTKVLSEVLGNETVFVFVKQSGESMPLAVIKKRVADCPFTVDFDSKHSMIAGKVLTEGMKVEVVAKLSKTGNPLDKSDELRVSTKQFILKSVNEPIEVEIN